MSKYTAEVNWSLDSNDNFAARTYSRAHSWKFDGGIEVPASASPQVVALPYSVEAAVDPEEAFIASLSSCHMLWFLHVASAKRWVVTEYSDQAEGLLSKDSDGHLAMTRVTLHPKIQFIGESPSAEDVEKLHHRAHKLCFIANSVKTDIQIEPRY